MECYEDTNTIEDFKKELGDVTRKHVFGELDYTIEKAGLSVYSVYRWAKERRFDPNYNPSESNADEEYAQQKIDMFKGQNMRFIINELIDAQTDIVWLRRLTEGFNDPKSPKDKYEAKRYVAFLFFDDIVNSCLHSDDVCPREMFSKWMPDILDLLKSLSIEDYCKIKGYLAFLTRCSSNYGGSNGRQKTDFLDALAQLDEAFVNCGQNYGDEFIEPPYMSNHEWRKVEQAKLNRSDTLGLLSKKTISQFMKTYYGFLRSYIHGMNKSEDSCKALRELYRAGNTRIVNAAEYILKCAFCSFVSNSEHLAIRKECFKGGLKSNEVEAS